ncbi:MAG: DUF2442 domain-containing protein [Saprospiraceae bacterium]|nr:DUF2442 domain-containing protein [Saprospiraceae bacterium]
MVVTHKIEKIEFRSDLMLLYIDGQEIQVPLEKVSERLRRASDIERDMFKISPSGYGIHWPLIDEDLSVEKLLSEFGS